MSRKQVDDYQHRPRLCPDIIDEADHRLRHAADRQQPRIDAGGGDDDEYLGAHVGRSHGCLPEIAPTEVAVEVLRHDDGVDCGDGAGFGGVEDARVDAAQDDARRHQGEDAVTRRLDETLPFELLRTADLIDAGVDIDVARHQGGQQQTRHEAGDEQLDHRDLGRTAVEDHADGRRDDNRDAPPPRRRRRR